MGEVQASQVVLNCLALLAVCLLPTLVGMTGPRYFIIAFGLGCLFLWYGIRSGPQPFAGLCPAAHVCFHSSILPVLLTAMALDKLPL